jgi:hypothetical protein
MDKMNGKSSLKSLFFLKWGSVIIRAIAKYYLDVYTSITLSTSPNDYFVDIINIIFTPDYFFDILKWLLRRHH